MTAIDRPAEDARARRVAAWTRASVRGLKPYYKAPVDGDAIRLDQNTNRFGPNPALDEVDTGSLDVSLYPSRDADGLLHALAAHHGTASRGLSADNFVVGNGSDEALDLIVKAFGPAGSTLATPWPSYSLYPFYAALGDLRLRQVPLRGAFRTDIDALVAEPAAITLIASPNNPTGHRTSRGDLERVLRESDGIVVVDEAYIEYAAEGASMLPRVEAFDNLIVMRTFSKAYGIAGLRVGYLAANRELVARLRVVKPPFNLNVWAEQAAVAALARQDFVARVVRDTVTERGRLAEALKVLGVRVHASEANFLLFDVDDAPGAVAAGLRDEGILVRTFPGATGLEHGVRVTVGTAAENDAFLAALEKVLA